MISIEELQADVDNITDFAAVAVVYGALELVLDKGAIDYNNLEVIIDSLRYLLDTNVANKDSGYLLGGILKDESSRVTGYFSQELYLSDKAEEIIAILENVAYIARTQEFNTLQEVLDFVKDPKARKVIVNTQINNALLALSEILGVKNNSLSLAKS